MHEDDWGDQETIGVHLKRHNYSITNENDFAIYLGQYENGYLVGIINWSNEVISGELFDTLDELKQEWIID